jgi:tetratricopeptide (TPR) repeat protein
VIPRSSTLQFKNRQDDLELIGSKLDAKAILTGQINVHGDELNIRVELVDVDEDRQLWGDRYAVTLDDILSVEQDIVTKISDALRLQLTGTEQTKLAAGYTDNPRAHRLYLKGRYYWNKRTEEDFYKAIDYFEHAIDEAPDYALAYGGLAETYALFVDYRIMESEEAYPRAKAAAYKAIHIDASLAEPYTALGYVLTFGDWDWAGAEEQYRRAIELNPNCANAHHWYALLLCVLGRNDEALMEIERAQEIDPLSLIMKATKADVLYCSRRYNEAIDECREALEMDPDFEPVLRALGDTYRQMQMYNEAVTIYKDLGVDCLPHLAATYALAGMEVEAQRVLQELAILRKDDAASSSTTIAMAYMGLNDKNLAFEYLELAYKLQNFGLPFIASDPAWDPLRDDPRFIDLVRRLGLGTTLVPTR